MIHQNMLANLSNLFRTKMPTHYTLLNVLMNKDRYIKHHCKKDQVVQWDRLVFYLFMIIQRIRNRHNFSWYGLINGASTWKHNGGNMNVHLGLCLSRQSIVGKLKVKFSRAQVEQMIIDRLCQELITIGSFDNTQLMRLLKYQREGHSSIASIVTSLLFLLANKPKHHDITIYPEGHPKITYLDQAIPSPMGMPHYHEEELVDAKSFTLDHALDYIHDIW